MRALAALVALGALAACAPEAPGRDYRTWDVTGDRIPAARVVTPEARVPDGEVPWAGIVSHHLLTDGLIEDWFADLARRRSVSTFWILSPSHWGVSSQPVSVADGRWAVRGGWVSTDREASRRFARRLGVALDPEAFLPEHGVSTLIPYIHRHFPGAKVVALAYRGEPPVDQPAAQSLTDALEPEFRLRENGGAFLLLSADFAHHGDWAGTQVKDARSRLWIDQPQSKNWIFVGCDNRPGLYALAHLLGPRDRLTVLFHTNSWALSGLEPDNITSYFFAQVWSPRGR